MDELFVIRQAINIFYLLTPILKLLGNIFCLPQIILKHIKREYIKNQIIENYIMLTLNLIFYLIYIGVYLNFHFIIFFKYFLKVDSIFQLTFSFAILNILTTFIYKINDMQFFIKDDVHSLIYFLNYELIWVIILIFVIIQFGNSSLDINNFLRFRANHLGIFDIWYLLFIGLFQTIFLLILHVTILLHLCNPISFIRALSIIRTQYNWRILKLSIESAMHIIEDMFLILMYAFNSVFFVSFIKDHIQLVKDIASERYLSIAYNIDNKGNLTEGNLFLENLRMTNFSQFERKIPYARLYLYLKHVLIYKSFKKNLKYLTGIILCSILLLFIWRIKNIFGIFKKFLNNEDITELIINFSFEFVDGFLEILMPIVLIYNHSNPINLISLNRLRNYFTVAKEKKNSKFSTSIPSYVEMNFFIFIQKTFDIFVTLLSLNINFTLVIYYLRLRKLNKSIKFFPILFEDEKFLNSAPINEVISNPEISKKNSKLENKNYHCNSLTTLSKLFVTRRKKLLSYIINSALTNFLIILNIFAIFNPFYGMKYFLEIYSFSYTSLNDFSDRSTKHYLQLSKILQKNLLRATLQLIIDIIFLLPLSLILVVTAPWNIHQFLLFVVKESVLEPVNKMKKMNNKDILTYTEIKDKTTMDTYKYQEIFIPSLWDSWLNGWILIFQISLIHLTIFRAFLLWKEFLLLSSYKKERIKKLINQDGLKFALLRKHSENTEIFLQLSDTNLLRNLISKHFEHNIKEIIFYPFLFLMLVLTPWNVYHLTAFTKNLKFGEKWAEFLLILKKFANDQKYIFLTLYLLISLIKTYKVLKLLYYSFRKNFIGDQTSIFLYETYYKNDYSTEIKNLSGGNFKKVLIAIMIIINILLVTRILSICRRLKAFIKKKFAEEYSTIVHLFDSKIPGIQHHFLHTASSRIICSICEFLPPGAVFELSLTSKIMYNKTQMNLVWKNMFDNYYKKKLKDSTSPEIYNLINEENYPDYKSACKEISQYAGKTIRLTEAQRDSFIGVYNIMLEETINSFLRIPHLLLIPAKLILSVFSLLGILMESLQMKFYSSRFFEKYLKGYYIVLPLDKFTFDKSYVNCSFEKVFFDAQILGVYNLFKIIIITITNIISMIFSAFVLMIKAICLTKISVPHLTRENLTLKQKLESIENKLLILYQAVISFIFIMIHFMILVCPIIYFYQESFTNLVAEHFSIKEGQIFTLLNPLNFLSLFQHCFTIWWHMGFFGRIFFLIGKWCRNIIWYYLNYAFLEFISFMFKNTNVIMYDVVKFVFNYNGLLTYFFLNLFSIIDYVLFPHVKLIKKLERFMNLNNRLVSLFINLVYLFMMFYPFYLNFKIQFTLYRFILLNAYAVVNMIMLIKKA